VDTIWPNAASSANSDPWIAQHHAEIREMRPRILALNFLNASPNSEMIAAMGKAIDAIREGSRYHGYDHADAPAFLRYEIGYAIDLRDSPPPPNWPYLMSSLYPRRQNPVQTAAHFDWNLDYGKLFTQEFADLMKIPDPGNSSHNLRMCELINRGMVHEVWIYGTEVANGPEGRPAEFVELKPFYDENRKRLDADMNRCAGNGCFGDSDIIPPECTRSVRIGWMNASRGPGCYLESLSHGYESMGAGNADLLPYLSRYFIPFANFDLGRHYGLSFDNWYACPYTDPHVNPCITFPDETTAQYRFVPNGPPDGGGGPVAQGTISPYDPVCGCVHFAPNARGEYDLDSPFTVLTSCQTYRYATVQKAQFTIDAFAPYASLASDCQGRWLVWWRQSFPGLDNLSLDDEGKPMLNWWPFLFY